MNIHEVGLLAVAVCIMGWAVQHWAAMPEVYRSWGTKECVYVLPIDAGSCGDLPDKYILEWVR